MINTMLGYSSAADWWTKKMDPNSIRGTFNWDLFRRVVAVKKEEELDKKISQFVSNEDALQQQHEEFIKQVELTGLPEWIVNLYN
jgi:hypothetical protein